MRELTKEEVKLLKTKEKLALKVKKAFPNVIVKYDPWSVSVCLGFNWYKDAKRNALGERIMKRFPGVDACADTSGGNIRTCYGA